MHRGIVVRQASRKITLLLVPIWQEKRDFVEGLSDQGHAEPGIIKFSVTWQPKGGLAVGRGSGFGRLESRGTLKIHLENAKGLLAADKNGKRYTTTPTVLGSPDLCNCYPALWPLTQVHQRLLAATRT